MKKIAPPLAAIVLVLLLAACSTGGGLSDAPQELDRQTAAEYQYLAYQGAQYQLAMLQNPNQFSTASVQTASGAEVPRPLTTLMATSGVEPQQTAECITESGNLTDADGDSIPVSATYTYDCHESNPDTGFSSSITGSASVSDKDDSRATSGYTMDVTDLKYSLTSDGQTMTFEFDLNLDLTVAGLRYDATFDFAFAMTGPDGSASFSFDFDQTYVAQDSIEPFSAGTLDFSGNLSMNSDGSFYRLDVSGPNLAVDDTCATGYRQGTTTYSDNAGNDVTVVFACDSATARFNGDPLASY